MPRKDSILKLRIPGDLKREAEEIAADRGESLAVLVRESLREYLDHLRREELDAKPPIQVVELEKTDSVAKLGEISESLAQLLDHISLISGSPRAASEAMQRARTGLKMDARSIDRESEERSLKVAEESEAYLTPNRVQIPKDLED